MSDVDLDVVDVVVVGDVIVSDYADTVGDGYTDVGGRDYTGGGVVCVVVVADISRSWYWQRREVDECC